MNDATSLLQVENLHKCYEPVNGHTVEVLRGVSLRLDRGQSLAILGPSGSGKSTLLHIIGMLDHPTTGLVRIEGDDVSRLNDRAQSQLRQRRIGFVFQSHHLLPQCTVLQNVLVPTLAAKREVSSDEFTGRAETLLERVGLSDRLSHLPGELSGGECQRVAVARALINQPDLILADEPTGSLDHTTADALGDLLCELHAEQQAALIVVTHTQRLADRMQRVVSLSDGQFIEGGHA